MNDSISQRLEQGDAVGEKTLLGLMSKAVDPVTGEAMSRRDLSGNAVNLLYLLLFVYHLSSDLQVLIRLPLALRLLYITFFQDEVHGTNSAQRSVLALKPPRKSLAMPSRCFRIWTQWSTKVFGCVTLSLLFSHE